MFIVNGVSGSSLHCINFGAATEPFCGSGSTLIACEQTHRICYAIELDEKFVDVIVKRYIETAGSSDQVFLIREGVRYPYQEVALDEE